MRRYWTLILALSVSLAILCLGWIGSSATGKSAALPPTKIVTHRISELTVGSPQNYRNLTVFPITGESLTGLDYLTLDEAMRQNAIEVTESGGGTVNQVIIRNRSGRRVFIQDGEELVGARQNRVLNSSVLIGPKQVAKVPVSCVEQGRWVGKSIQFESGGTQLFARARQMNVAAVNENYAAEPSAGAQSDQSRIWAHVGEKRAKLSLGDASGPMHEAYVKYDRNIDDYVKAFHTVPGQVGAIFAIDGNIIGADIFDQNRTLKRLFAKLVKSYALDAIEIRPIILKGDAIFPAPPRRGEADRFLRMVLEEGVSFRDYNSPGEGRDVRISSDKINGSSLVASGRPVHIALFAPEGPRPIPMDSQSGGIRPPSQRNR